MQLTKLAALILAGLVMVLPAGAAAPPASPAKIGVADPHAVPGFLDPATGNFTPLAPSRPASESTVGGVLTVHIETHFDVYITASTTIFCVVDVEFGSFNQFRSFVPDHFITAGINFAAAETRRTTISIPYSYNSKTEDKFTVELTCFALDETGAEHTATSFEPLMDLPDGNKSLEITTVF
jgi:hypothetical protein